MTARLVIALAVLLVLTGLAVWIYQQGGETVRTSIERLNNASGDKSDQARAGYDRCVDGGGMYDFATGQCRGASPGGRH